MDLHHTMDEHRHAVSVIRHGLKVLLNELTEVQLGTLQNMLEAIMMDKKNAFVYHGMTQALMESRFGICWACRSNPCESDQGIEQLLVPETADVKDFACPICGEIEDMANLPENLGEVFLLKCGHRLQKVMHAPRDTFIDVTQIEDGPKIPRDLKVGENGLLSPNQIVGMAEWNLDDVREDGTNKLLYFVCLGCMLQTHPTIEDRALNAKGVDGCSGCKQRAAHG